MLEFEFKVDCLVAVYVVGYVCTPYRLAPDISEMYLLRKSGESLTAIWKTKKRMILFRLTYYDTNCKLNLHLELMVRYRSHRSPSMSYFVSFGYILTSHRKGEKTMCKARC